MFALRSSDSSVELYVVNTNRSAEDTANILANSPDISYAEPNYPLELYSGYTQDEFAYKQSYINDYDLYKMWSLKQGYPVTVAIIDTGIDFEHEDLQNVVYTNPNEIVNGIDDDKNGYIDDINGYRWVRLSKYDTGKRPDDDHGHGNLIHANYVQHFEPDLSILSYKDTQIRTLEPI